VLLLYKEIFKELVVLRTFISQHQLSIPIKVMKNYYLRLKREEITWTFKAIKFLILLTTIRLAIKLIKQTMLRIQICWKLIKI
jgi:hypothetical protein